jgi:molybdenum cofactor cytidylyltransferase
MTVNETRKIGGILLAAGGSKRLGRPKQFLQLDGKTLLLRAAESMAASICDPIIAVLGGERERAEREIAGVRLKVCFNEDWESGMSSSIKVGLKKLLSMEANIDAVIISLCDQPFVNSDAIDRLAAKFLETGKHMVAARYDGVAGVPALFSRVMFDKLSLLEGDKGARDMLRDPNVSIETIEIEEAAVDIDTRDDMTATGLL